MEGIRPLPAGAERCYTTILFSGPRPHDNLYLFVHPKRQKKAPVYRCKQVLLHEKIRFSIQNGNLQDFAA